MEVDQGHVKEWNNSKQKKPKFCKKKKKTKQKNPKTINKL